MPINLNADLPKQEDDLLILVEDCEKRESRLSAWEREFIDSVGARLRAEKPLSEKQTDCLMRVWGKATEQG
jgi:hypothetical protein